MRVCVCVCVHVCIIDLENICKYIPLKCLQWLSLKEKVGSLFLLFVPFSHFSIMRRKLRTKNCQRENCQMIRIIDIKARKWSQIDKEQSNRSGCRLPSRTCLEQGAVANSTAGMCCHFPRITGILWSLGKTLGGTLARHWSGICVLSRPNCLGPVQLVQMGRRFPGLRGFQWGVCSTKPCWFVEPDIWCPPPKR